MRGDLRVRLWIYECLRMSNSLIVRLFCRIMLIYIIGGGFEVVKVVESVR